MPYLKNPAGRIVAIDDPDQVARYLGMPGFELLTPEEEEQHTKEEYAKRAAMIRTAKEAENRHGVFFHTVTPGERADGYGTSSTSIIEELKNLGVKVGTNYDGQKVGILYHAPYSLPTLQSPFRILYTMFESDKLPDDWRPYLEMADRILVPTRWCADVFKKFGFDAHVVPLGYDDRVYQFRERKEKAENRQFFNFLHYNAFNIRKGFPEVFKAFTQEFQPDEPVRLILKTTQHHGQIPTPFQSLEDQYPNIITIAEKLPSDKMQDLLTDSDCFVFPSRGEGFGMTPLEAMATGMPAIVPNAHGITEYFNPDYMYEVKVKETCPALYTRYKNEDVGKMVICDVKDLRRQMRYVYEHQAEARNMGKAASEYVKQWTYKKTAAQLKTIFEEFAEKEVPRKALKDYLLLEKIS